VARTWILTGSPENHAATRDHDFTVIGLKERNGHDADILVDQLTAAAGARA
jgi:hypothetical protein